MRNSKLTALLDLKTLSSKSVSVNTVCLSMPVQTCEKTDVSGTELYLNNDRIHI